MTRLQNPHWSEGEEVRRETTTSGMLDASADLANPEDCDECGEPVTSGRTTQEVNHPSHDAVFCSYECKSRWDNKLHHRLR